MDDTYLGLIVTLAVPAAYLWLQATALAYGFARGGGWALAALVPAVAMGAAVLVAVLGVMAGSNLAPIWVFLAAPPCLAWVIVFHLVRWLRGT